MSWIADTIGQGGVLGVFALTLVETVFPPIPSEVVMPLAGVAAARGAMPVWAAVAAGIAGSMSGNVLLYVMARRLGVRRFEQWIDRHGRWLTLDRDGVDRARLWFKARGGWAVGLGRCLPGIRSVISIPAGLVDMPWPSFLLWSMLGTTVWVSALTLTGYWLGSAGIPAIERWIGPVSNTLMVIALGLYLVRLATWRKGRHS